VGIIFSRTYWANGDHRIIDALIQRIENYANRQKPENVLTKNDMVHHSQLISQSSQFPVYFFKTLKGLYSPPAWSSGVLPF
jgi:hypothetical protein